MDHFIRSISVTYSVLDLNPNEALIISVDDGTQVQVAFCGLIHAVSTTMNPDQDW